MTPIRDDILALKALLEKLRDHADVPSAYQFVGDKIEDLFDPGLRHKPGKKPFDYLKQWLSMLRPFAFATRDESWGEMEKLLCIVMRNYVQMKRLSGEAAAALESLSAHVERMEAALEKAAGWFEDYSKQHYAKAKNAPDGGEQHSRETKGKINADRAKELRTALAATPRDGREA